MGKSNKAKMIGKEFGKLKVLSGPLKHKGAKCWNVICHCGRLRIVQDHKLRTGHTRSCGCTRKRKYKFNMIYSATYSSWGNMKTRCTNTKTRNYAFYGERGIGFCDRWDKFENFLADMGEKPLGLTLERKDNNKDYGPENCSWASRKTQANNRRNSIVLTFNSITLTIPYWAKRLKVKADTIRHRYYKGLPIDKILKEEKEVAV